MIKNKILVWILKRIFLHSKKLRGEWYYNTKMVLFGKNKETGIRWIEGYDKDGNWLSYSPLFVKCRDDI